MPLRSARRLPGIRFEAPPPQLDEVLPRMDIAAFVGFAASGPVHVPVAVESAAEFEAIFGVDAPLAWDPRRGETVYGKLAPAVRAFFRNGGTRCWVVRVAGRPISNFFPIPGVVRLSRATDVAPGDNVRMTPAFARARADGSWSDRLRVGSALALTPIDVVRLTRDGARLVVEAAVTTPGALAAGDLLRLAMDGGDVVMLPIDDVTVLDPSPPSDRPRVRVAGRPRWFRASPPSPLPSSPLQAVLYNTSREPVDVDETFASAPVPILNPVADWTSAAAADEVRLDLQIEIENAPEPGALISVDAGSDQLWIAVRDVGVLAENASGADRVRVTGSGLWWQRTPPDPTSLRVNRAHRLALELWVRSDDTSLVLRELGLAPDHPRYWAKLQHDNARYGDESSTGRQSALAGEHFFPLAGAGAADALYVPIDVALTPDSFLGAARQPGTALERDGLAKFSPALFLDPDLITPLTERVQNEAEHVRYTAELPRRLTGMHATLEIEEATIIAVPDAVHPGWTRVTADTTAPPQPSPPNPQPARGTFLACATAIFAKPQWAARLREPSPLKFDAGTFTLEWEPAGSGFVVEESHQGDWSDSTVIYSGADTRVPIYGRPHGTYYYRVRATDGRQTSDWSDGLVVVVAGAQAWQLADDRSYSPETLIAVHRGLLRMSAARGDLFALLTLPEHYRANDTLAHVSLLKSADAPAIPVDVDRPSMPISLPLGAAEARVFSYGALYHPWLILREQTSAAPLVRVPPDGSMAGLFAQRARRRGAWIAPANEALGGVVALSPAIARGERLPLLDALVNVVRQEPRGFLPVSANTLSDDPDLGSINVRRLLSLLRRLALREGTTYVFEPHDDSFRRLVQRGFEGLLTHMFERGAFAGRNTASAFQVNTSTSLNTPQSVDAGRFIVELRVAPSQPMSFLTVRLVQSGDRTLVMEDR